MRKVLLVLACAAVLVSSFDLFFIVGEGEQAVVTQLGKPVGKATEPGLHVKVPFLQRAVFVEKRIMGWKSGPLELSSSDRMPLAVEVYARWRISDPLAFHATLGTSEQAYAKLDNTLPPAARARVMENTLAELVRSGAAFETVNPELTSPAFTAVAGGAGRVKPGRDRIMEALRADAAKALKGLGIEVVDVRIRRLGFQEGILAKVYERMISERKARAALTRSEGEGRRAELAGLMEKELQALRSEAFRAAEEIRGKADAEAAAIYGRAYRQDPEFYSFLKTLETYRSTPFENTTLILGADSDFYKLLKGPSK